MFQYIISLTSSNPNVTHTASNIIFYFVSGDAHCKCVLSVHSTCRGSLWRRMCVFVSGEQMDSAPSPLLSCVLLAGVWHERATGHGNQKRSHVIPPGPPISSSGRHLPHLQPTAAWRSLSLRTLGERERGGAADLSQAGPRGRSQPAVATSAAPACCLTFGQWEVWNGCLVGCDVLCVYVSAYVSVPQMYACHLVD